MMHLHCFGISIYSLLLSISLSISSLVWWADIAKSQIVIDEAQLTSRESCGDKCINIVGGTNAGPNLFHSFVEFNIRPQQTIRFNSPEGITRIFSRVTGENPSQIRGTLEVEKNADLFLLNPNGISFGSDAHLNIGGSFTATTANEIRFEQRGVFSTIDTGSDLSLLSIAPSAFFFHHQNPASIDYQVKREGEGSLNFGVSMENTIRFLGGPISLLGEGRIHAFRGQIELVSVTGIGEVVFSEETGQVLPSSPSLYLADVTLSDGISIDAASGNIRIMAHNLTLRDGARVRVNAFENRPPGKIKIHATGNIRLQNLTPEQVRNTGLFARVPLSASNPRRPGRIMITTRFLTLEGGAKITTSTQTESPGGIIEIEADESVVLRGLLRSGRTGVFSNSNDDGGAGNITINSDRLTIQDGATIATRNTNGNAGIITLNVDELILDNGASIFSVIGTNEIGGIGEGGDIHLNIRQLEIQNESRISSSVRRGIGDGGNIFIQGLNNNSLDFVFLGNDSEISTSVGGKGEGGNIILEADSLVARRSGNSDITSNAQNGSGGRIDLDLSGGLLGMTVLNRSIVGTNLNLNDLRTNSTNDVAALSEQDPSLDGEVIINTPGVDPDRRLPELPGQLEVPQLQQRCYGDRPSTASNSFIPTGRGGLPPTPNQTDITLTVWEDLRSLADSPGAEPLASSDAVVVEAIAPQPIQEAQGWRIGENGNVILTAHSTLATPPRLPASSVPPCSS